MQEPIIWPDGHLSEQRATTEEDWERRRDGQLGEERSDGDSGSWFSDLLQILFLGL